MKFSWLIPLILGKLKLASRKYIKIEISKKEERNFVFESNEEYKKIFKSEKIINMKENTIRENIKPGSLVLIVLKKEKSFE